jgi:hypothetical protein
LAHTKPDERTPYSYSKGIGRIARIIKKTNQLQDRRKRLIKSRGYTEADVVAINHAIAKRADKAIKRLRDQILTANDFAMHDPIPTSRKEKRSLALNRARDLISGASS